MDSYLIIKANEKSEYKKYSYLLDKFSVSFVIWTDENADTIVDKLSELVSPYSKWKLFIMDLSKAVDVKNPFADKEMEEVQNLIRKDFFVFGKDTCRPPEKIYILARRKKKNLSGIKGDDLEGMVIEIPSCRFLLMDYPLQNYLRIYEDLKVISFIIILAVNDMPPEIMEAYAVYLVEIGINDWKLQQFLKAEKNALEDEQWKMEKEKYEIENWRGEEDYKELNTELPNSAFKTMQVESRLLGIRNLGTLKRWQREKVRLAVRLERIKKEELEKQSELKSELKNRINALSANDIVLEKGEIESIQKDIRQLQQELNESFIELWELDRELAEEEWEKENKVDNIYQNFFSWKEIVFETLGILGLIFIIFLSFLCVEQNYLVEIFNQPDDYASKINWMQECMNSMKLYFIVLPLLFIFMVVAMDTCEIYKKKTELNQVLRKIEDKLRTNIAHYKKFYTTIYQLKVKENYILKGQNYIRHKKEKMKLLAEKEEKWNIRNKQFEVLDNLFTQLLKDSGNDKQMMHSDENAALLNVGEDKLYNPFCFVESLSIIKEVEDEY